MRRWLLLGLALLPFTALAIARIAEGPQANAEDYAQYLLHARALAEGRDYRDIGFITTRFNPFIGPVAMPPGTTLLILPAVVFGGVGSPLIPYVMIFSALAFILLASRYFAEREKLPLALSVALVSGLQPMLLSLASQVNSDIPFAALIWATILLCEREGPWGWRRVAAVSILGSAAISFRLAGVALIPALGAYALLRASTLGARPLVPLVVWGATFKLTSVFLSTTAALGPKISLEASSLLESVRLVIPTYAYAVAEAQFYPFPSQRANMIFHVATLGLLVVGIGVSVARYWRSFLGLFAFSYVAMLLLVPVSDQRYLIPLIPLVVFLTVRGAVAALTLIWTKNPNQHVPRLAAAATAVVALIAVTLRWTPVEPKGITTFPDVQALFSVVRNLDAASPSRVQVFRPRILALETRVPAMALFRAEPDTILAELCVKRIDFVVLGDLGLFPAETESLGGAVRLAPAAFQVRYRNDSFTLYAFDPSAAPACAASNASGSARISQ